MPKKKSDFNFEDSMKKLEEIVEKMEAGDLTLEESIEQFEQGMILTKSCQKTLDDAEQKIKILLKKNGKDELDDFDEDEE